MTKARKVTLPDFFVKFRFIALTRKLRINN